MVRAEARLGWSRAAGGARPCGPVLALPRDQRAPPSSARPAEQRRTQSGDPARDIGEA